jgi:hypothetical protein
MGVREYAKTACLPRHDHDFGGHPGIEFTPSQFVPYGGIDGDACEEIGGAEAYTHHNDGLLSNAPQLLDRTTKRVPAKCRYFCRGTNYESAWPASGCAGLRPAVRCR